MSIVSYGVYHICDVLGFDFWAQRLAIWGMERALIDHVSAGAHAVYGQNALKLFSCSCGKHIDIVSVASKCSLLEYSCFVSHESFGFICQFYI